MISVNKPNFSCTTQDRKIDTNSIEYGCQVNYGRQFSCGQRESSTAGRFQRVGTSLLFKSQTDSRATLSYKAVLSSYAPILTCLDWGRICRRGPSSQQPMLFFLLARNVQDRLVRAKIVSGSAWLVPMQMQIQESSHSLELSIDRLFSFYNKCVLDTCEARMKGSGADCDSLRKTLSRVCNSVLVDTNNFFFMTKGRDSRFTSLQHVF